jgi:hypothetical protein
LTVEMNIHIYKSKQDQIQTIEKRRTLKKQSRSLKEIKKMKKTRTSIVTNDIRAKSVLNLFSTTKFKKQNGKHRSKESLKEMCLLKSLKMKTTMIQKN